MGDFIMFILIVVAVLFSLAAFVHVTGEKKMDPRISQLNMELVAFKQHASQLHDEAEKHLIERLLALEQEWAGKLRMATFERNVHVYHHEAQRLTQKALSPAEAILDEIQTNRVRAAVKKAALAAKTLSKNQKGRA